ncbi:hypothetical protein N356_gp110 [Cellulophaga phage phi14:2]|uniref:Uncharacterized protein n=1 Tax=Cellulophaga phage phi14:2 TaxID=1327990 RepID=S0A3L2_9CAUD|nr:hypothetical protein N356_gp110 [Cellulophaga phage phi14:2]AGO49007.1 hypothetical protein Phi14:2_gp129 [Cellulophaga phage phi14:2]
MSNAMGNFREREVEYNGKTQIEYQTAARLVRLGKESPNLNYVNAQGVKKNYILNTIEVDMPGGKTKQFSAMCYEANYKPEARKDFAEGDDEPLEVGVSYLTTLRFGEDGTPNLQMSHLTNANRATADDFAFLVQGKDGALEFESESDEAKTEAAKALEGAPEENGTN